MLQREARKPGRLRALWAAVADRVRRRSPLEAERDWLQAELATARTDLAAARADLAGQAQAAMALAADQIRLQDALLNARGELVLQSDAATAAQDRLQDALLNARGELARQSEAAAAAQGRLQAELAESRADLARERERVAALAAERDKAAFEAEMAQAGFDAVRQMAEPERDLLLLRRDGLATVVTDATLDRGRRMAILEHAILDGGVEPAMRVLEQLSANRQHGDFVRKGLGLCGWLGRSGLLDAFEPVAAPIGPGASATPVLRVPLRRRSPSADKIVLIFKGTGSRFWAETQFLFHALAPFSQHLVFLMETRACLFTDGIQGLSPGYGNSLADLRALCAAMGDLPIYCIGHSTGGFGALRYGLDLGARAVLAFSPWTTLLANVDPSDPIDIWASRCMRANAIDLRPLFDGRADIPRLTLYHGALNGRDTRHAQRFADLPGARVIGIENFAEHTSLAHLMAQGQLERIFAEFLGQPLPAPPVTSAGAAS